jgi:hypothetical protein
MTPTLTPTLTWTLSPQAMVPVAVVGDSFDEVSGSNHGPELLNVLPDLPEPSAHSLGQVVPELPDMAPPPSKEDVLKKEFDVSVGGMTVAFAPVIWPGPARRAIAFIAFIAPATPPVGLSRCSSSSSTPPGSTAWTWAWASTSQTSWTLPPRCRATPLTTVRTLGGMAGRRGAECGGGHG